MLLAAIRYALGLWQARTRYCDDDRAGNRQQCCRTGSCAWSHQVGNPYLFAGSDNGGEPAAEPIEPMP
jgi:hypothetical protein